ncbi:hypothetical protein D9611_014433 [Ephemerocybe angulata]|uniref:Extracellular metalloproteinase n=1 Tax=Ephemerocybe angulata TaxID=980116 RepID=A0A8H5ARU6_9AGAR|nr:hypothetical protein D9611_014433 [Tulosesus angulatus]
MAVTTTLSKVFSTLLATILLCSVVTLAAPFEQPWLRHATHRRREIGRGLKVESYHPKSQFKTFGDAGATVPASNSLVAPSLKESAMSYVASLGWTDDKVAWKSGYTAGETGFAYIKQAHNNITFANAVCNVALNGDKVASWGSSLIDLENASIAPSEPTVGLQSVLPQIEDQLDARFHNETEPTLEYFVKSDGSVALTHVIQAKNAESGAFYEAYVDAHSGELVSVTDFVSHASYTVLPATKTDFTEGVETLQDPEDLTTSPLGWHALRQGVDSTTTSGNNVIAFRGQTPSTETSATLNFNSEYDDTKDPTLASNIAASTTNAFFIINTMHDIWYKYGFTESAFNFQSNNLGKGGKQNDRVQISVQDGSGTNNANFATPPDGQSGQCRMFIWTLTTPNRDGAMENDIIIHEYTHGLTNRMTGGGTGRCLQTLEAGGLGEGWGDAMADWMSQSSAQTADFGVGKYVTNKAAGLRSAPYSTNAKTNTLRYSSIRKQQEVHNIGEVWANMLHNVQDALVQARGFSEEKLTNPDAPEGNVVFMRLFIDALAVQPCNPTFVQARDAWIQADQIRFNGANKCTLFKAFASRGLGLNADDQFIDDTTVPPEC